MHLGQGVNVPLNQKGPFRPCFRRQGKKPQHPPGQKNPVAPFPKAPGHEQGQKGKKVHSTPGGEYPPGSLHQAVAQETPGEGQIPLLREPLQRYPPPHPGQRCGGEGEKEAEGESLEKYQGKEGQSPKGAKKLGKALGKPDEVQTPKPKAHEEARAETPLKEKGQNHGGQKAKGKRRKGKG
ncbi:hypothetical protein AN926_05770 [Thermus scotoductus]|uniref:Uncharacterized protein n=1 Tax=Thermus scotoductus TaxID=37636 RepID=A0A0N1KPF3_THESC|nr:hypothetical protein AN926_05770 [Thermus scotoductus]